MYVYQHNNSVSQTVAGFEVLANPNIFSARTVTVYCTLSLTPHFDADSVTMPALVGNGNEHSVTDSSSISDTVRLRGKHVKGICEVKEIHRKF